MKNKLLRPDKKIIDKIKITNDNKIGLKEWEDLYINDKLKHEVQYYDKFKDYILDKLLGYKTKDISHEYPLKNGRKVEYMLLKDNEAYIPIELKGCSIDLDKHKDKKTGLTPVEQCYNYAGKIDNCEWYIVSNYYEFRLYNKKSQKEYISFTLDDLKAEKYLKTFIYIFSKKTLIESNELDKQLNNTILPSDYNFENNFYKLFNETRQMLVKEISHSNPTIKKDKSIYLTQKFLNRYIFICFAEDKGLLPPETSTKALKNPIEDDDIGDNFLFRRINELFLMVNKGSEYKNINKFNGGLFKENLRNDLGLKKIRDIIKDKNFFKDCLTGWKFAEEQINEVNTTLGKYKEIINPIFHNLLLISSFNFNSEIDVNILGHIFENSIADIEKLKQNTENNKRKKDGIFYTPDHITQYICENTIIPYLSKNGSINKIDELIKEYKEDLNTLESKLKDIKIIDISCGSGAFLNKATDILFNIYKAINDENTLDSYFNPIETRGEILINNIYGVDLNEESVEITKLGMFLKIASEKTELPYLDKNIKTGNSLIENIKYAGVKAFKWEKEFQEIMKDGGFNIILGNPPYVRQEKIKEMKPYLKEEYKTYTGVADLYVYFFEKGLELLRKDGYLGFICSNKYTRANYGKKLRELILNYNINNYNDYTGKKLFEGATVDPSTIIINKQHDKNNEILINNDFKMKQNRLDNGSWSFESSEVLDLRDKIKKNGTPIKDIDEISINRGITTGFNKAFIINKNTKIELITEDPKNEEIIKPVVQGKDIKKWNINYHENYLLYIPWGFEIEKYPSIEKYLSNFKKDLLKRPEVKDKRFKWYELSRYGSDYVNDFKKSKLIYPELAKETMFNLDLNKYFSIDTTYILTVNNDLSLYYLLVLFNSKLINWQFDKISSKLGKQAVRFKKTYIEQISLCISKEKEQFINLAHEMIDLNEKMNQETKSFHKYLISDFNISKINKKLTEYYNLSFEDLYKEVKKQYKQITRKEKDKLEKEYTLSIEIMVPLQKEIKKIDNEIDKLVYELYELTDKEIKIIEKSFS